MPKSSAIAVEEPARHPELVGDLERRQRADLELPLAGHHFGVDAGDAETGFEARVEVRFDDVAAVHLVGADAAVVEALRRREAAAVREAVRTAVLEERVLLLDAEQRLVARVLLRDRREQRARVRRVRRHVGEQHLAHDELVVAAADRVGTREHGLQHAVRVAARRLVRARTVEAPDREVRAVREDLRLRPQPSASARCRRSRCTPPCRPRLAPPAGRRCSSHVLDGSVSRSRQCSGPRFPGRCLICERSVTGASPACGTSHTLRTLLAWSASSSTYCARSRSAGCASCGCGSPMSSAS